MGVIPLQFLPGESATTWQMSGSELLSVQGLQQIQNGVVPKRVKVLVKDESGAARSFEVLVRIDTPAEADYYRNGGILPFVLRNLLNE
jgi:aconitate hydratase